MTDSQIVVGAFDRRLLLQKTRKTTIAIGIYLTALFVVDALTLLVVFLSTHRSLFDTLGVGVVATAASFGGSCIYFSRKCYVYLITEKFVRVIDEVKAASPDDIDIAERVGGRLAGYFLYLTMRPLCGAALGPLTYLISLCGLLALKASGTGEKELSLTGQYLVTLAAFAAGHASSDMFDYLTQRARRALSLKRDDE